MWLGCVVDVWSLTLMTWSYSSMVCAHGRGWMVLHMPRCLRCTMRLTVVGMVLVYLPGAHIRYSSCCRGVTWPAEKTDGPGLPPLAGAQLPCAALRLPSTGAKGKRNLRAGRVSTPGRDSEFADAVGSHYVMSNSPSRSQGGAIRCKVRAHVGGYADRGQCGHDRSAVEH